MIINHHFRVELKDHKFNSSTVNKRFSHPVISNLTSHFFISNQLRSLSADSRDARPSRVKPSYHPITVCLHKKFFSTSKLYSSHPSSSSKAVRIYFPPSRQTNHHVVLHECPEEFFQGPVCWDPSRKSPHKPQYEQGSLGRTQAQGV